MITVEKKEVSKTGVARVCWFLGRGYFNEKITIRKEVWCVLENGKVLAECRSRLSADKISRALNPVWSN